MMGVKQKQKDPGRRSTAGKTKQKEPHVIASRRKTARQSRVFNNKERKEYFFILDCFPPRTLRALAAKGTFAKTLCPGHGRAIKGKIMVLFRFTETRKTALGLESGAAK